MVEQFAPNKVAKLEIFWRRCKDLLGKITFKSFIISLVSNENYVAKFAIFHQILDTFSERIVFYNLKEFSRNIL